MPEKSASNAASDLCRLVGHDWCDCGVCQVDNFFTLLCRRCRHMEDVKRSPYAPMPVNTRLIETVRRGINPLSWWPQ